MQLVLQDRCPAVFIDATGDEESKNKYMPVTEV
jgi:hypothetical protein